MFPLVTHIHEETPSKVQLVDERATHTSVLVRSYQRYLQDGETARFIQAVASRYSLATLLRVLQEGDTYRRRAAALALGFIGDVSCNEALGPLLCDRDRKVRLVVDDALRAIWSRDGAPDQRHLLERVMRLNECGDHEQAVKLATELIDCNSQFAEAYHQRSLALFHVDCIAEAIEDCRRVLQLNHFHYAAMIGLGHCHLELGDLLESLTWFRAALETYPDLEPVRMQVRRLEIAIQEL
ncbi:MAG: HEAT repeat domain-containing protein [Aureliella sp.]|jgi:tetratricopeptide (TPR) repeat protein